MKPIYEILILIYEEYVKDIDPNNSAKSLKYDGLCSVIEDLWACDKITTEENGIIDEYLYKNKPKKLYDYYYFWKPYVRYLRLLWMVKHIGLTCPEGSKIITVTEVLQEDVNIDYSREDGK